MLELWTKNLFFRVLLSLVHNGTTPLELRGFLMSKLQNQRQQFLLTFFPDQSKRYEKKEVNGFILVKHIVNGDSTQFEVAIYPKDHFTAAEEYKKFKASSK